MNSNEHILGNSNWQFIATNTFNKKELNFSVSRKSKNTIERFRTPKNYAFRFRVKRQSHPISLKRTLTYC